jgi:single-stranded DNA-binding protein
MTEASVSVAGNLTDAPSYGTPRGGIAQAMFRTAVSGRGDGEASFFTVILRTARLGRAYGRVHDEGQPGGGRGSLQQRTWTAEDGSARSVVEVVAKELGPSNCAG